MTKGIAGLKLTPLELKIAARLARTSGQTAAEIGWAVYDYDNRNQRTRMALRALLRMEHKRLVFREDSRWCLTSRGLNAKETDRDQPRG